MTIVIGEYDPLNMVLKLYSGMKKGYLIDECCECDV